METLLWGLLGWVLFPLWLLSGMADYAVHRRTSIETTSGTHESLLHLLQTAEIALPALLLLFLEVNALTLSLMALGVAAHSWTAWRDVRYADSRREITPFEQIVHAFLFSLPVFAFAVVALLHWPQARALFDPGDAPAGAWRLAWKSPPFEAGVVAAVLGASVLFGVLPGLAELRATLKARARRG
jgi:hypothetical protein